MSAQSFLPGMLLPLRKRAREVSLEVTQPVSVKGGSVSGALPILRYLLPPSSWTLPNPSQ